MSAEINLKCVSLFAGDMSTRTGTFSVGSAGVYQMSFTAKYVSSSKGRFGAWSDIYVNNTVSGKVKTSFTRNAITSAYDLTCCRQVLHSTPGWSFHLIFSDLEEAIPCSIHDTEFSDPKM